MIKSVMKKNNIVKIIPLFKKLLVDVYSMSDLFKNLWGKKRKSTTRRYEMDLFKSIITWIWQYKNYSDHV